MGSDRYYLLLYRGVGEKGVDSRIKRSLSWKKMACANCRNGMGRLPQWPRPNEEKEFVEDVSRKFFSFVFLEVSS